MTHMKLSNGVVGILVEGGGPPCSFLLGSQVEVIVARGDCYKIVRWFDSDEQQAFHFFDEPDAPRSFRKSSVGIEMMIDCKWALMLSVDDVNALRNHLAKSGTQRP